MSPLFIAAGALSAAFLAGCSSSDDSTGQTSGGSDSVGGGDEGTSDGGTTPQDLKDNDGDGYFDCSSSSDLAALCAGRNIAESDYDCDDDSNESFPGATETCDGLDNDCDGTADNNAVDASRWCLDEDGDGFGNAAFDVLACAAPAGYVSDDNDCDDANTRVHPRASEVCDEIDNDCNGLTDDEDSAVSGQSTWYKDSDLDGFGTSTETYLACEMPMGFVANTDDCDDSSDQIFLGAMELCNGVDESCDGVIDEGLPLHTFFADADGDTYGDPDVAAQTCFTSLAGHVDNADDCDDSNAAFNPAATEDTSNQRDGNCDGYTEINTATAASHSIEGMDGEQFGYSLSGGCDLNADGIADFVAGAPYSNEAGFTEGGAAYVVYGSGVDNAPYGGITWIDGTGDYDGAGASVGCLGDYNGDGYDDLAVGIPGDDTTAANAGQVAIKFGPITGSLTTADADVVVNGAANGDVFGGGAISSADVNGDGLVDVLMGTPSVNPITDSSFGVGAVYLFFGDNSSSATVPTTHLANGAATVIRGDASREALGRIALLDDINADGLADVIVTATGGASNRGEVFIYESPVSGVLSPLDADVTYTGAQANERVGSAVAAGDVNGDGHADIVAGASGNSTYRRQSGAAYVVYGPHSSSIVSSALGAFIYGTTIDGLLGTGQAAIGDLNRDGVDDVLIGTTEVGNGRVYGFIGGATLLTGTLADTDADHFFIPRARGGQMGSALTFSDLDGDGFDDLMIGDLAQNSSTTDYGFAGIVNIFSNL